MTAATSPGSVHPELVGRVALVTGAGRGIGAAVCRALLARGATVAALDRDAGGLHALQVQHADAALSCHIADVGDSAAVDGAVAAVEERAGPIEVLVNVAGILRAAPVVGLDDAAWAEVFAVNTTGVFHVSRAVARRMVPRSRGCIVTVSSNAGGVPRAGMAAYAASKAAATMFTRCLGLELARTGIRCNVVSPGSTDTAMQRQLWGDADPDAAARRVIDGDPAAFRVGIPLGRIADPADVAEAVVFLASDRARHITMQDLYVDGGATLRG